MRLLAVATLLMIYQRMPASLSIRETEVCAAHMVLKNMAFMCMRLVMVDESAHTCKLLT
jgi:hypothetical protein